MVHIVWMSFLFHCKIYSWSLSTYFLNSGCLNWVIENDHEINYSHATDIWGANIFDGKCFEIFRFFITVDIFVITHYKSYIMIIRVSDSESLNGFGQLGCPRYKKRIDCQLNWFEISLNYVKLNFKLDGYCDYVSRYNIKHIICSMQHTVCNMLNIIRLEADCI